MTALDSALDYLTKHPYSTASALTAATGAAYIVWDRNRILDAYQRRLKGAEDVEVGLETPYLSQDSRTDESEIVEATAATGTEVRAKLANLSDRYVSKPAKNIQKYSKEHSKALAERSKAMAGDLRATAVSHPKTLIAAGMAFGGILGLLFFSRKAYSRPLTASEHALHEATKQWRKLRKGVAGIRH